MGNGEKKNAPPRPYAAPQLRDLDAHEVIRKLFAGLNSPLGDTREQRVANGTRAINAILERLPIEERGETLQRVIAASPGWLR